MNGKTVGSLDPGTCTLACSLLGLPSGCKGCRDVLGTSCDAPPVGTPRPEGRASGRVPQPQPSPGHGATPRQSRPGWLLGLAGEKQAGAERQSCPRGFLSGYLSLV